MKITKLVEVEVEVEAYFSTSEIIEALCSIGRPSNFKEAADILNRLNNLAREIPLEWFSENQREIVATAFRRISERFSGAVIDAQTGSEGE